MKPDFDPFPTSSPPPLRTIWVLAALAVYMTCMLLLKGWQQWHAAPSIRPTFHHDAIQGCIVWGSILWACLSYLRYRQRLTAMGETAQPRPWRSRRELRIVLLVIAITLMLEFPLAIIQAIRIMDYEKTTGWRALANSFPITESMQAMGGAMVLIYDHSRARNEINRSGHLCGVCGYDLRGSTGICPECGSPEQATTTPEHPATAREPDADAPRTE